MASSLRTDLATAPFESSSTSDKASPSSLARAEASEGEEAIRISPGAVKGGSGGGGGGGGGEREVGGAREIEVEAMVVVEGQKEARRPEGRRATVFARIEAG